MNSILDDLQIVQTIDDQTNLHNPKSNPYPAQDLYSSSDQYQLNNNLKVSSSTKPSILLSSSHTYRQKPTTTTNSTQCKNLIMQSNQNQIHQNLTLSDDLKKLNENDQFHCQSCSHQFNLYCELCQGKKRLNGNDKIVKFFEYILEFKLGKKQSYKPKEEKYLTKRNKPNEHCNMYFSTVIPKLSLEDKHLPKVRFSINNDVMIRDDSIIQCQEVANCKEIHNGFCCDQCEINPIKGLRYHCNECEDFDLCEDCFLRVGHRHDLQKIEHKGNTKAFDIINHMLRNANSSSLKSSIRNSSSLRSGIGSKTCKSWIR